MPGPVLQEGTQPVATSTSHAGPSRARSSQPLLVPVT